MTENIRTQRQFCFFKKGRSKVGGFNDQNAASVKLIELRPDSTSKLVHGTPKFYFAPYYKINNCLVNLSNNCDVNSGLKISQTLKSGF